MSDVIGQLAARAGHYRGRGVNHEGQAFVGEARLEAVAAAAGVLVSFTARGDDGTTYHAEGGLIAADGDGVPTLSVVSSFAASTQRYVHRSDEPTVAGADRSHAFGLGARDDQTITRLEVAFDLWPDGDLTMRWSWALPGDDFQARSSVRMRTVGDA